MGKSSTGVAQSYKCNQCGKILSNMANLELHANKTGHSDFEESTESIKPLTAEEEAEKVDHIEREKQRRFMGKEMKKTREEMEIKQRKNEAYLRKKKKKKNFFWKKKKKKKKKS